MATTFPITIPDVNDIVGITKTQATIQSALSAQHNAVSSLEGVTAPVQGQLNEKQSTLVSGTSVKTLNGESLLGSGDISIVSCTEAAVKSIVHASGSAPIYAVRAWVEFNASGTPSIRANGNVTSLTDYAVGNWGVNMAIAMPDTNYAVLVTADFSIGTGFKGTTSTAYVYSYTDDGADVDPTDMSVAIIR